MLVLPPRSVVLDSPRRSGPFKGVTFLSLSAIGSASCRSRAVAEMFSNKGFFCPCVLRKKPLDVHVRKPPGADACGDDVSLELLQNATTLILALWSFETGSSAVAAELAFPLLRGACPLSGFGSGDSNLLSRREATWLILPVVICLSQRLSHACLSTCRIKAKPRMAH